MNYIEIDSYFKLSHEQRVDAIIALSKPQAFFITFFNNLANANSKIECFNKLNELHFEIYQEYMYSDYNSFRVVFTRYLNKKPKYKNEK